MSWQWYGNWHATALSICRSHVSRSFESETAHMRSDTPPFSIVWDTSAMLLYALRTCIVSSCHSYRRDRIGGTASLEREHWAHRNNCNRFSSCVFRIWFARLQSVGKCTLHLPHDVPMNDLCRFSAHTEKREIIEPMNWTWILTEGDERQIQKQISKIICD